MGDLNRLLSAFVARGDASAMDELVRRTRPRLLRAARRIGAPQDAEDTVQAAYYSLLRAGDLGGAPPFAWLLTAVVRIAYRRKALARKDAEIARHLDRPRAAGDPLDRAAHAERAQLLRAEIAGLPAKYADVVVLRGLEGLSSGETARLLDVPVSTVTTRLRRARRLLRARLKPRLAWLGLAGVWLLQDAARAATPVLGGTMTAKTTVAVGGLVVAAGLLGFGTAHIAGARAEPAPRDAQTRQIAELEHELAAAREMARRSQARLSAIEEAARPTRPDAAPPAPPTPRTPAATAKVQSLSTVAKTLDVPEHVLAAAVRADNLLQKGSADANEAVRELARYGEDGFKAVVALLRSGRAGERYRSKLIPATYREGLESLLLETAELSGLPSFTVGTAIIGLAIADTPGVREYLVERIRRERNPTIFWHLVMALSKLHEDRGALACADKLVFDDPLAEADWKPFRRGMLYHLGQMGGPLALRVLSDYLRDPRVTDPDDILAGLNGAYVIDRKTCGELATAIQESPRAGPFDEEKLETLSNLARAR